MRGATLAASPVVRSFLSPRLVRQLVSSGIATSFDLVVLFALCHAAGVAPGIAAVAGAALGGAVNFAISRSWVFETRNSMLPQLYLYLVLVVAGGALINGAVVSAVATIGAPLLIAKALAIGAVMVGWTYPVSARIFRTG